jgi:hypothetical protein
MYLKIAFRPSDRPTPSINRPISVYRLGVVPIQSCGQIVSAPCGKAGVRLNANTELRAERQRSAREAIYRNRPISDCRPDESDHPMFLIHRVRGPCSV